MFKKNILQEIRTFAKKEVLRPLQDEDFNTDNNPNKINSILKEISVYHSNIQIIIDQIKELESNLTFEIKKRGDNNIKISNLDRLQRLNSAPTLSRQEKDEKIKITEKFNVIENIISYIEQIKTDIEQNLKAEEHFKDTLAELSLEKAKRIKEGIEALLLYKAHHEASRKMRSDILLGKTLRHIEILPAYAASQEDDKEYKLLLRLDSMCMHNSDLTLDELKAAFDDYKKSVSYKNAIKLTYENKPDTKKKTTSKDYQYPKTYTYTQEDHIDYMFSCWVNELLSIKTEFKIEDLRYLLELDSPPKQLDLDDISVNEKEQNFKDTIYSVILELKDDFATQNIHFTVPSHHSPYPWYFEGISIIPVQGFATHEQHYEETKIQRNSLLVDQQNPLRYLQSQNFSRGIQLLRPVMKELTNRFPKLKLKKVFNSPASPLLKIFPATVSMMHEYQFYRLLNSTDYLSPYEKNILNAMELLHIKKRAGINTSSHIDELAQAIYAAVFKKVLEDIPENIVFITPEEPWHFNEDGLPTPSLGRVHVKKGLFGWGGWL